MQQLLQMIFEQLTVISAQGGSSGSAGYNINDKDDSSSPKYYGFEKADGAWYIMKESGDTYRYAKGSSDYTTNWTNRASLSYDYYGNVF